MNKDCLDYLKCPNCHATNFHLKTFQEEQNEITEGCLTCSSCNVWYRIEDGILDFLELGLRRNDLYSSFAKKHDLFFSVQNINVDDHGRKLKEIEFSKKAGDYDAQVANSTFYQAFDKVYYLEWVLKNLRSGDLILDLGCGTGSLCIQAAQKGIRIIAIDISEEMLKIAKEKVNQLKLRNKIDLIVADAGNPPLKDNKFKACTIFSALHHFPNPQKAIINSVNKLSENGLLVTFDPHTSPLRFIFDFMMKIWRLYDDDIHVDHLISEKRLSQWLKNAGVNPHIKICVLLPPHLGYMVSTENNVRLLRLSDSISNKVPLMSKLGGMIFSESKKTLTTAAVKG